MRDAKPGFLVACYMSYLPTQFSSSHVMRNLGPSEAQCAKSSTLKSCLPTRFSNRLRCNTNGSE